MSRFMRFTPPAVPKEADAGQSRFALQVIENPGSRTRQSRGLLNVREEEAAPVASAPPPFHP
jgi:hypothetical protein